MRHWLHAVSAQWVGAVLAVITLGVAAATGGVLLWAWSRMSLEARALAALSIVAVLWAILVTNYWFTLGRDSLRKKVEWQTRTELADKHEAALANQELKAQERLKVEHLLTRGAKYEVSQLQPAAAWANALIDRERGYVGHLIDWKVELWNEERLNDAEPFFEVRLSFTYSGALRLLVGEQVSGRLEWHGKQFAREPIASVGTGKDLPFHGDGPTTGAIRLRQYVTPARAHEIKAFLGRNVIEMEFWAKDFFITVAKESFSGEVVAEGKLGGDYLTAKTRVSVGKPSPFAKEVGS